MSSRKGRVFRKRGYNKYGRWIYLIIKKCFFCSTFNVKCFLIFATVAKTKTAIKGTAKSKTKTTRGESGTKSCAMSAAMTACNHGLNLFTNRFHSLLNATEDRKSVV